MTKSLETNMYLSKIEGLKAVAQQSILAECRSIKFDLLKIWRVGSIPAGHLIVGLLTEFRQ